MEVILTPNCKAFTGRLENYTGYEIQCHNGRFYSKRSSRRQIPPDGHWLFILKCVEITKKKLYFADILISGKEIIEALQQAGHPLPSSIKRRHTYNATEFNSLIYAQFGDL